ncbi:hypothetical protein [Sulfobacillus thermosulfidooxidans]|uniref:hypothetical protein n=1 Tax=Sulfobacillus thermosulfidooxidans TaxID=28034 RepID=UPI000ACB3CEF|nr:hypothetical protein [Sulfobacillus thermosulfidooxidans]
MATQREWHSRLPFRVSNRWTKPLLLFGEGWTGNTRFLLEKEPLVLGQSVSSAEKLQHKCFDPQAAFGCREDTLEFYKDEQS